MKKLLLLAFIAIAGEPMAQDAQCADIDLEPVLLVAAAALQYRKKDLSQG
jgi:hypothetical protein